MTVSQFFDPTIRQWAESIQPTDQNILERVNTFRLYALESAERFQWPDETNLSLNIRELFEERQSSLQEARDYLVWATEEFCTGILEQAEALEDAQQAHIIKLEPIQTRPDHIIVLDWPMVRGGGQA